MKKIALIILGCLVLLVSSIMLAGMITFREEPWIEKIAVIPIVGAISADNELLRGDGVTIRSVLDSIESAERNPSVKAIVFEINSPGGSPVASEEIAANIKKIKKPTVAWIGDIGTSGAYWIASASDKVVAHPMSITGSIGAYSSFFKLEGLMDKLGIGHEIIKSGKFKDIGSPYRNLTDEEKEIFKKMVSEIHEEFVRAIAENRKLGLDYVHNISDGRPYLGREALRLRLVDELGNEKDAIKLAAEMANSTTEKTLYYGAERNPLRELILESASSLGYGIGRGLLRTSIFG